ncbi:RNase adapter RapZ, partial [Streptomyces sp. 2MCAF27]
MSDDTFRRAYGRIFDLQRQSEELLARTRTRAEYDELRGRADNCAEFNDEEGLAAASRALKEYGDTPPPKVTTEEVVEYYKTRTATLRALAAELDGEEFREALADAEAKLAELTRSVDVRIISFGYGHHGDALPDGLAPEIVLDLRRHFRDPHVHPELVQLTGHDEPVHRLVMDTEGIVPLIEATVAAVRAFRSGPSAGPVTVAVGCAGGRHRSVAFSISLGTWLRDEMSVTVEHLDDERDIIQRTAQV